MWVRFPPALLAARGSVVRRSLESTEEAVRNILECGFHEAASSVKRSQRSKAIVELESGIRLINELADLKDDLTVKLSAAKATLERRVDLRLLLQMHSVLMDSVRGDRKSPGQFRTEQNWIGPEGCTIEAAKFVPPSPDGLPEHLQAFERYITYDDIDALIQCAVVHAQFEILHPFKDGNGRIGRLLVPLFLFQTRTLASPMFYLSEFLEADRDTYYLLTYDFGRSVTMAIGRGGSSFSLMPWRNRH